MNVELIKRVVIEFLYENTLKVENARQGDTYGVKQGFIRCINPETASKAASWNGIGKAFGRNSFKLVNHRWLAHFPLKNDFIILLNVLLEMIDSLQLKCGDARHCSL